MPDTGDFDRDQNEHATHADWAGAFAALPWETPALDGWQRLQARLPVAAAPRRKSVRWPLWLATAASLGLAVVIPMRMQSNATVTATPSPNLATSSPATDTGIDAASIRAASALIENTRTTTPMPTPETTANAREPRRGQSVGSSQRPIRTAAQPTHTTRMASAETTDVPVSDPSLESLYSQSAQLEGLLAMARDERVSSGTAAALTDTLDSRVASIDAALAQSEVSPQARTDLWHHRLDTLRQLVGIETTQRLYAARGQQYEAALVSID